MEQLYHNMKIAGVERSLPLCKISDDLMIGAFVIVGDVELTEACARELNALAPEHDIMITAETKGFPLVAEMARQAGEKRFILARKEAKLYMHDVFKVELRSITTDHRQQLFLDLTDAERIRGRRVLIVDDVVSTGESLAAMEALVKKAGGEIVGRMCILAEGEATHREDLIYLEKLPLFRGDGTPIEE